MRKTRVSQASAGAFLEILRMLGDGEKRFSEIRKNAGRSDKTVSDTLRKAENFRLVDKKPVKKEGEVFAAYSLTPQGNRFVREVLEWERKLTQ